MINTNRFVGFIAVCLFTACAAPPSNDNAPALPQNTAPAAAANPTADTSKSVWNNGNAIPQGSPATPQPATKSADVALNPPHGQPNHRCDIEVGAPLNSPSQQPQQAVPTTAKPTTPAKGAQGSVKLNPAHGEPGHDCGVAVGAPLKSS